MYNLHYKKKILRKIPVILIAVSLFSFVVSGCGIKPLTKLELANNMQNGFSLDADITYGEMNAKATVKRIGDKKYQLSMTAPSHLKGIEVEYENSNLSISYLGFGIKVDENNFPASSMIKSIIASLDSGIFDESSELKRQDGLYEINGECNAGVYKLILDGETQLPKELEIQEIGLKCTFVKNEA